MLLCFLLCFTGVDQFGAPVTLEKDILFGAWDWVRNKGKNTIYLSHFSNNSLLPSPKGWTEHFRTEHFIQNIRYILFCLPEAFEHPGPNPLDPNPNP